MSRKLVLASESFLKHFILEKAKLKFTAIPANIDETIYDDLDVAKRVVALAHDKAEVVAKLSPDAIIVSADVLTSDNDGTVFTKPGTDNDPFKAAMSLSGKTITVHTGCTMYDAAIGFRDHYCATKLTYRTFTKRTLERLVGDDNYRIRSGALGVFYDAPGFTLIERIEGSYTGALGLPMEFIHEQLESLEK